MYLSTGVHVALEHSRRRALQAGVVAAPQSKLTANELRRRCRTFPCWRVAGHRSMWATMVVILLLIYFSS